MVNDLRSPIRTLLSTLGLAFAGTALLAVQPATADTVTWACYSYSSAQTCWAGTGYRGYKEVGNSTSDGGGAVTRSEVCAKAVTAAGNIRTGSGCSYNTWLRGSCLSSSSPNSAAYVYWAGSSSATNNNGWAYTPSSSWC